ncbi:fumarylacetoacetate hydrolase family protein [Paenibacillus solisilvae]|uniref:Fumarylacetoacetate hydrolase family protein n=1 Tax=Paenibacillus solisilvae TaxID=2486751 RepID=A0ABW0VRX3_9BACL
MKLIRFKAGGEAEERSGILDGIRIHEFAGDLFGDRPLTGETYFLQDITLCAPLAPRHIIGIGKNFAAPGTAKPDIPEIPIFFFKPLGTVVGPLDPVILPEGTDGIKFESELAVIIGKEARNLTADEAETVIFGYTVANDFGAINYFHPEGHWTVGKSFDTFCPLGPLIETEFNYREARIQAEVNGVMKQDDYMSSAIMPVDRMIAYVSGFMTLKPGDVILTGTPAGADFVGNGDIVDAIIDGIGRLRNPVRISKQIAY